MFRDRPHRARLSASKPSPSECGGRLRCRVSACPGRPPWWRCVRGDDTLPGRYPAAAPVSTQNPSSPAASPAPCGRCFGQDAEHAWGNCRQLAVDAAVVEESHFIVQLRSCPGCAQRYLWIFTEFVDWENGEDAQYRRILPVTQAEAAAVARQGAAVDLDYLGSLGRGRRYLKVDWPSDQPAPTISWSSGEFPVTPGY